MKLYFRNLTAPRSPVFDEKSSFLPLGTLNTNFPTTLGAQRLLMLTRKGPTQSSFSANSLAQTAQQSAYMGRFTSLPLAAATFGSGTWTVAWAALEGNTNANAFLRVSVYVWRPRTRAVVGFIYDGAADLGTEWATAETGRTATFTGSNVTCENGDLLVVETWQRGTQGMAVAYVLTFHYNGTTDPVDGTATTNAASYIDSPAAIAFFNEPYRVVFGCEFGNRGNTEADLEAGTWGTEIIEDSTIKATGRFSLHTSGGVTDQNYLGFTVWPVATTLYVHDRFRLITALSSTTGGILAAYLHDGTVSGARFHITLNSSGNLQIVRNTTVVATGTVALSSGTWYTVQLDIPSWGASVTVTARVYNDAGSTLLDTVTATGQDTTGVGADEFVQVLIGHGTYADLGFAPEVLHDDLIVRGDAAPDPAARCFPLNPNANGGLTAWTGVYTDVDDMVDQAGPDALTDEVTSSTINQEESHGLEDLASGSTVFASVTLYRHHSSVSVNADATPFIYDGTTTRYGGTRIGDAGAGVLTGRETWPVMPDGSAWTLVGLNALQVGERNERAVFVAQKCVLVYAVAKSQAETPVSQTSVQPLEGLLRLQPIALQPLEAKLSLAPTALQPLESLLSVARTEQQPTEALLGLFPNAVQSYEAAGTIAVLASHPWESKLSLTRTTLQPWEALLFLATPKVQPLEAGLKLTVQAGQPYEAAGVIVVLALQPLEALLRLTRNASQPLGSLTGLTRGAQQPLEAVLLLTRTSAQPYESAGTISAQALQSWEALLQLIRLTVQPLESRQFVSRVAEQPFEATLLLVRTIVQPWEARGFQVVSQTAIQPLESLLKLTPTARQEWESLLKLLVGASQPLESGLTLTQVELQPYESVTSLIKSALQPYETAGTTFQVSVQPYEAKLTLVQLALGSLESLRALTVSASGVWESLAGIRQLEVQPVESKGLLIVVQVEPYEASASVLQSFPMPYESGTALTQVEVQVLESLRGVLQIQQQPYEAIGVIVVSATQPWEARAFVIIGQEIHPVAKKIVLRAAPGVAVGKKHIIVLRPRKQPKLQ